ncbi:branched-chain amino acid ABC transporter permease [Cupriavidus basilensis]|uniref:Branched-chain amino acid transport system permease protein LivM n=1 Tax=Cupriavidus basilensis TaxID=68895 RepID=A0A0C4YPE4_9BURK|nr:branched-chain amino acid ABC transporter permease [Cupriavidus basilensis]AJG22456.1 Branched-chain amino acid transport system permease protein LivM [Cupriavidus basilensis]
MIDYLLSYQSVLDHILIYSLLAMSQAIALRAGTFSIGSAAFAAIGAYTTAILVTRLGWWPPLAMASGVALAGGISLMMAFPLSRLRGVFQAVATLALVQVIVTVAMNWDDVTRGALGITGIPKAATTGWLILIVAMAMALVHTLSRFSLGRAMDVIRQDETVAVSLGISVAYHQRLAMTLSGLLAGLAGALSACNAYAVNPEDFGFHMLVQALAMAVLGGQTSLWGPLVGATVLTLLPELFRVFEEFRDVAQGALLMLIIIYLPHGIADTLAGLAHDRRVKRVAAQGARTASQQTGGAGA